MKKLDIYIIRKFLSTFFYSIFLLIIIIIIFDISEKIDDFLEHNAPLSEIIFSYYLNFIPYFINLFSPLFTFIAVIFFTSKMAVHTEIIAILSSGISYFRMLRPYMISALFLAALSFSLSNFLIPVTNRAMINFDKTYLSDPFRNRDINIHMQLEPGTFVYMESYNNLINTGYKFTIEKADKDGLYYKLSADLIRWDSVNNSWTIQNYYERFIDGIGEKIKFGTSLDTTFNMYPSFFTFDKEDVRMMNFFQLNEFIRNEKMKGSQEIRFYEIEKYQRFSDPLSTIILTLIAVTMSSRKQRGGIGLHLGMGLAIAFSYILFMKVAVVFGTYGTLSPAVAVWIPGLLFALVAIYLLKITPK